MNPISYPYSRYHGLGNDYLVIDPRHWPIPLNAGMIRLLCHRHYGIGSDGLVYGPFWQEGQIHLRIYNPDGSLAEKSGNGLRIFARYLYEQGDVGRHFTLYPTGGAVTADLLDATGTQIRLAMGTATFWSHHIPVLGATREVVGEEMMVGERPYRLTCLSLGNPHAVIFTPQTSEDLTRQLGPLVENHPNFPQRINFQLVQVIDRQTIALHIWERGAGYTLASGSSTCAAVAAAHRHGLTARQVAAQMPGGTLYVDIGDDGMLSLTGPVSGLSSGQLHPNLVQEVVNRISSSSAQK